MKVCRDAMIDICRQVKPMGVMYHRASMVIAAIDALARRLTVQRIVSRSGDRGRTRRSPRSSRFL